MKDDLRAVQVRVTGRVQGVGFRWWTKAQADALGLSGFVRNEPDGAVQAILEGPEKAVQAMLLRLGEGPAGARVDTIDVQDLGASGVSGGFEIRR